MTDGRALIDIQGLIKAYDILPVLRQLNLSVERGEFIALLGPNGSGKSTLLRLLAGLSSLTGGVIRVGGWQIPQEAAAVRSQIGMVSHQSLLYDNLTARENLRFFGQLYNLHEIDTRINTLLEQVGLHRRGDSLVRTFSRGMQQRLSIARALLHAPDVLLFDEPYTGLDQDAAHTLDGLLQQAHAEGRTIIMTTHDLERVPRLASRIVILSRGVVAFDALTSGMDAQQLATIYSETTSMATAR